MEIEIGTALGFAVKLGKYVFNKNKQRNIRNILKEDTKQPPVYNNIKDNTYLLYKLITQNAQNNETSDVIENHFKQIEGNSANAFQIAQNLKEQISNNLKQNNITAEKFIINFKSLLILQKVTKNLDFSLKFDILIDKYTKTFIENITKTQKIAENFETLVSLHNGDMKDTMSSLLEFTDFKDIISQITKIQGVNMQEFGEIFIEHLQKLDLPPKEIDKTLKLATALIENPEYKEDFIKGSTSTTINNSKNSERTPSNKVTEISAEQVISKNTDIEIN